MTFRLPFQIPRVGALCRPGNPLFSKLVARKGNLKKHILSQINQIRSADLLKGFKHKTTYVPTTKSECEYSTKPKQPQKIVQKAKLKLIAKEYGSNDYYQQKDGTNFGSYYNQEPINQVKPKKTFSTRYNKGYTTLPKYGYYEMESYFNKIKDYDDQMSSTTIPQTIPLICSPELNIRNIMPDSELKIQNDIWKQSCSAILNNLNSKKSNWRFLYGKRLSLKHSWKDIFTSVSAKTKQKSSTVQQGIKQYPYIYMSTKRKPKKINLDNTNKNLPTSSRLQPRLLHKTEKRKSSKERKADSDERKKTARISDEYLKDNTQASVIKETNKTPNTETKNSITDSKNKISHLTVKTNSSKMFVRHQSKSSKVEVQPNLFIKMDKQFFSKPNVIMVTVCNRILNHPSPEFMESYSYSNSFYHKNAMKDLESFNTFKYPKICYNAENDTYLLHSELVAEGLLPSESTLVTDKTNNASVSLKSVTSDKIIKAITSNKLIAKTTDKEKTSLATTKEGSIKQCSLKPAKLEKLKEKVSDTDNKQKLGKVERPISKKKDQKIGNKIRSTKIPKTLGEIYGVGKIPFLIEVSEAGHAKLKQYLVVLQLPGNKNQETSETNTNSPLPLNFLPDYYEEESIYVDDIQNCFNKPVQTLPCKKQQPNVSSMIGLVKVKNKILPLLELNDTRFDPLFPTKLSHLIQSNKNKKENDTAWAQKAYVQYRLNEQKKYNADVQSRLVASLSPPVSERYKQKQLRSILNTSEYHQKSQGHVRQYSTLSIRLQRKNALNYKIFPQAHHNSRTVDFQQKCSLCSCLECPYCGQFPCTCGQSSPCGWYPRYCCRPQCCPKFKLDYCCPRARWDCSIPIPPCQKIEAPYPSYGECMPTWCKEPTECFDYETHMLQPKNQLSPKINLMEEATPKVTVVDPALDRKCCRDKMCEPCPPCIDQRICFDCPYKIPVDNCCPRGRPHCYCWPDRPCVRKPPPYRCFSDEDLEFPEVEVTEHDLARRFASDLYRRMGKKCKLPFVPVCSVDCDLRSGEPIPVCKHDPKACWPPTCCPPGAYPATCTMQRIPPCEIPGCDTCINCCMPLEGHKKTRCSKRCCPQDCCGYCAKEMPECPKDNEE